MSCFKYLKLIPKITFKKKKKIKKKHLKNKKKNKKKIKKTFNKKNQHQLSFNLIKKSKNIKNL